MQGMGRGTARRAVEGQGGCGNRCRHGVHVSQNISGSDTKLSQAALCQGGIALCIANRPTSSIMRLTINFDDQSSISAVEVSNVASDRMLAAKPGTALPSAKTLPKQDFGQAHFST